jgi:Ca2+-binding RTX toxin-like protein
MKPVLPLEQIVEKLRINWGERPWLADDQGEHRDWSDHATVTYSFPTVVNDGPFLPEGDALRPMNSIQMDAARLAFELWDDVVPLNLTEAAPNDGEITFAYSASTTGGGTYAQTFEEDIGTNLHEARVWINSTDRETDGLLEDFFFGSFGFYTYLHEIGHSLGLTHPGRYDSGDSDPDFYVEDAEYMQDTQRYTVMSYFDADADGSGTSHWGSDGLWKYAATPLLHDIAAMQAIYGVDTETRTGNTVYGFNSTAGRDFDTIPPFFNDPFDFAQNPNPIFAIWDAGGNDTLDASGFATNQTIRLGAGEYSSIGALTNNITIAFGGVQNAIENAIGGSGNDTISGNDSSNRLEGGRGNDTLTGSLRSTNADTLLGGAGNDGLWGGGGDTLMGGVDNDRYYVTSGDIVSEAFNEGHDTVETELASYTLTPNVEDLVFINDEFDVTGAHHGIGNGRNNTITGAGGDDTLDGLGGVDTLNGADGGDTLNGGFGNDILNGAGGNDTLNGDQDADTLDGGTGTDTLNGGSGNDTLYGRAENDILNGGADNDTLVGGEAKDTLTGGSGADTFRFHNVSESSVTPLAKGRVLDTVDTITDFQHGIDKIDLRPIDADPTRGHDQAFIFLTSPDLYAGDWTGKLWVVAGTTAPFTPGGLPGSSGGPITGSTPTMVYASTDADAAAEFQIELRWGPTVTAGDFYL